MDSAYSFSESQAKKCHNVKRLSLVKTVTLKVYNKSEDVNNLFLYTVENKELSLIN